MGWISFQKGIRYRKDAADSTMCYAAYIGAEATACDFTGRKVDYRHFRDVYAKGVVVPANAPDALAAIAAQTSPALQDFGRYLESEETRIVRHWNRKRDPSIVEALLDKAMTDGRYVIALPRELTIEQNLALASDYLSTVFAADGYAVAYSVNALDENPHLHIVCCTRVMTPTGLGSRALSFNRYFQRKYRLIFEREQFAAIGNKHLLAAGCEPRLDHRSYADQGLEKLPARRRKPSRIGR